MFFAHIKYYFHTSVLKVRYSLTSFMDPCTYAQKYVSLSQRHTLSLFTYSRCLSTLQLFSSKIPAKEERSSIRIVGKTCQICGRINVMGPSHSICPPCSLFTLVSPFLILHLLVRGLEHNRNE